MRLRFLSEAHPSLGRTLGTILACSLLAPSGVSGREAGGAGSRGCKALQVSSTPETVARSKPPRYSGGQILDLNFRVVLHPGTRFDTDDTLEMRYFGPNGHLYEAVVFPVSSAAAGPSARRVAGHPFPVAIRRSRKEGPRGGEQHVVDAPPLAVGGTAITVNSLYGLWRAEAWEPGRSAACASIAFVIEP